MERITSFTCIPDAGHGFFYYDRPAYRQAQAVDGWQKIFTFLEKHLRHTCIGSGLSVQTGKNRYETLSILLDTGFTILKQGSHLRNLLGIALLLSGGVRRCAP